MMTDDQIIAVVQAHREGKQIQVLCSGIWMNCDNPCEIFDNDTYRIAPKPRKPREWTLQINGEGNICNPARGRTRKPSEYVRVREVIE